ncbi:hypothetical protein L9F63_022365, partial [Diploptera punctata]
MSDLEDFDHVFDVFVYGFLNLKYYAILYNINLYKVFIKFVRNAVNIRCTVTFYTVFVKKVFVGFVFPDFNRVK